MKEEVEEKKEEGKKGDFCHMPGFLNFQEEDSKGVNNVKFPKNEGSRGNQKWDTQYKI